MKVFGYVNFWGKSFSPNRATSETGVRFSSSNEVGEIGKKGKYKSKPFDYGSASIDFDCEKSNLLIPTSITDAIRQHKGTFERLGAEDIEISLTFAYEAQCNLVFSPAFLKTIAELGVPLLVSCYEDH